MGNCRKKNATKTSLGYVVIIFYHWWYFNWGGGARPLGPPSPLATPMLEAMACELAHNQDFGKGRRLIPKAKVQMCEFGRRIEQTSVQPLEAMGSEGKKQLLGNFF